MPTPARPVRIPPLPLMAEVGSPLGQISKRFVAACKDGLGIRCVRICDGFATGTMDSVKSAD